MNKIIQAAQLAKECHCGQFRKWTNTPYIFHPMRVAGRVSLLLPAVDSSMVCAAWLHDVLEDCTLTATQRKRWPDEDSFHLVRELTNEFSKEKYPQLNRAERKLLECGRISRISYRAKLIKVCDRIDNLSEMGTAKNGFINRYLEESSQLADALLTGCQDYHPMLAGLVAELKAMVTGFKKPVTLPRPETAYKLFLARSDQIKKEAS